MKQVPLLDFYISFVVDFLLLILLLVTIRHNLVGAVDWLVSSIVLCDSVECRESWQLSRDDKSDFFVNRV